MAQDPAQLVYRPAVPGDAAECVALRGRTRQNAVSADRLQSVGITVASWGGDIASGALPGWVCTSAGRLAGYCFGASATGEVVVLALLPEFENQGVGKALLQRVVKHLQGLGHTRLFLGCSDDPDSRSYGFYRHLGWRSTGRADAHGDELLEFDSPLTDPLRCPLCGGPNACAVAASGSLDAACWCKDVTFSAGMLARVPANAQGKACICRRCAAPGQRG